MLNDNNKRLKYMEIMKIMFRKQIETNRSFKQEEQNNKSKKELKTL